MAFNAYIIFEGEKQGKFKGDSTLAAPAGSSRLLAYTYEVTSPRDIASGLPTGKRMHKPFVILKEWDASSPQMLQACVANEVLRVVTLAFHRTTSSGEQQLYHTVTLSNATISNLKQYVADPVLAAEYDAADLEEVSFTYQKITISYTQGNKSAVDDWEA
ncbi:MAG TPA: type VI secretion system tube protein TssD [Chloroflexota bacterium]|nr:type VI secretion system tube protein TssD [Chloroflexota bacterium]